MPDINTAWSVAAFVILAAITAVGEWWRRSKPARDRDEAVRDAILGKAPVLDPAGGTIEPAQPGLVHRTITLEDSVKALIDLVADQKAIEARVDHHEVRLNDHDAHLAQLIAHTFERGATAALNAAEKLEGK